MNELPDCELVLLVRQGCKEAGGVLADRHQGLVYKAIRQLRNLSNWIDYDDLAQEGRIAILSACKSWEPGKGTKFSSYAYRSIWWAVVGESNRLEKQCRHCQEGEGLLSEVPAKERLESLDLSLLTPRQRRLLELVFGLSGGEALGCDDRGQVRAGRRLGLDGRHSRLEYRRAIARLRETG